MCGQFVQNKEVDELIRDFIADGGKIADWTPSYRIRPTNQIPVVVEHGEPGDVQRSVETARWSLIPRWSKELKPKFPTFNARSETAAEKASFKASVVSKRAIVPATGYYEWHTVADVKQPYFVHDGAEQLAFAGLYSWWRASDADDWILTATILTRAAVGDVAEIHDRTPVTLPPDFWSEWLDPGTKGDQSLVDAAVDAATPVAERLQFHRIAPLRGFGPETIEPA